jgi:hypothetical protein
MCSLHKSKKDAHFISKTKKSMFINCDMGGEGLPLCYMSGAEIVVDIATGYGLDDQGIGVRVPVESAIFSSPRRPDRLWDLPSLLSNGYRGLFLRVKVAGA